jgi:hypothetical protein
MEDPDLAAVIKLVQGQIDEDVAAGRDRRLGPLNEPLLRTSLDHYPGLCAVLQNEETGELRGCALVMAFEEVSGEIDETRFDQAEAAKLTVRRPFVGTEGASILHALRVVSVALPYDEGPTLYYNVLSGNRRQLDYMRDLEFETASPRGYLAKVLEQRRRTLDLGDQQILTFTPSPRTVDSALAILFEAAADRVLRRVDRDSAEPHLQAWELSMDHPLLTDELAILVDFAEERGVAVPKHVRARLAGNEGGRA